MPDRRRPVQSPPATPLASLEHQHGQYELCAFCPKLCRFACPVSEADARESLTPWAKMSAPYLAMRPHPEVELATAFETSWACTGCGHCTEYCLHGNDVPTALVAVRAAGASAGIASPVTDRVRAAFAKSGNPSGKDHAVLLREKVPSAARDDGRAPVLFLPGCSTTVPDPVLLKSASKILERLGGRGVAIACDGMCCGSALWWAGLVSEFDAHAARVVKTFAKRRTLVMADAGCAWTMKVLYARRGHTLAPEVLHVSEWIAAFFQERALRARGRIDGKFWYHDPCALARDLEVHDEPRAVLAAVLEDKASEFAWNRRDAVCCGAGGLLPQSMPDTARRMAEKRAEEPRAAGATIVTSSPTCQRHFRANGVEAEDLLTLVARAL